MFGPNVADKYASADILTPDAPCHLLVWGEGNQVDQSCFKSFNGLRSRSLNHAPTREFEEEIHDYGEFSKYRYVDQAMAKAYP